MPEDFAQQAQLLEQGLATLGLQVSITPFMQWLALFLHWNKAKNLSAIRSPDAVVIKHLLDSLALHPWLSGDRIFDVGTGAGLPGVPLALAFPEKQFVLCDSNIKKVAFVRTVIHQLELTNVSVIYQRAEQYAPERGFDSIVSRAVSSVSTLIDQTQHLRSAQGQWLVMQGHRQPVSLEGNYHCECFPLTVPFLSAERHVLRVRTGTVS